MQQVNRQKIVDSLIVLRTVLITNSYITSYQYSTLGGKTMARISKQVLLKLQKKLKVDSKIGAEFGITRQAVYQLRVKYGIPAVQGRNDERNAKIIDMHKQGKTGLAIAKKMKMSRCCVYGILSRGKKAKTKAKK